MRALLDRESPLYHAVYTQRTCYERINSESQNLDVSDNKCTRSSKSEIDQYMNSINE
jgi:hypothetical protein